MYMSPSPKRGIRKEGSGKGVTLAAGERDPGKSCPLNGDTKQ